MWKTVKTQDTLFPTHPLPVKHLLLYSHSHFPINKTRWRKMDHIAYADEKRVKDLSQENIPKKKNQRIPQLLD